MCKTGTSFVSLGEAARLLGTTEPRILMMIKHRELAGIIEDGAWRVDRASVSSCRAPEPAGIVTQRCGGGCGGCDGQ